jgi:metallo-beta-lactamase family protein
MGHMLKLIEAGFNAPIYLTNVTADITKLQLKQELYGYIRRNKEIKGKRFTSGPKKGQFIPFENTYQNEFKKAISLFASNNEQKKQKEQKDESQNDEEGFRYREPIQASNELKITFYDAGHIPGSAQVLFEINNGSRKEKLLTCVDLGRIDYDVPLVNEPDKDLPKDIDYVVIEATYGDRVHTPLKESIETLKKSVKDTYDNNGKLIIPSFSIMRSQMLWNFLYRLNKTGEIPDIPIYISSPTAVEASKLFLKHPETLDETARKEFKNQAHNPFKFPGLVFHDRPQDTLELLRKGSKANPYVINAASGMCDYGRVVYILRDTISDPKNIILLTGYSAPGTRAYLLKNAKELGIKKIDFDGVGVSLNSEVRRMHGLSGHADCREMISHLKGINDPSNGEQFKGIYIKHGERDACYAMKGALIAAGYMPESIHVMKKAQRYVLNGEK